MKSQLALIVTTALLALGAATALAQPTVTTDKMDYPPGSTVNITGAGFQPGETVQCQVLRTDIDENSGPEHVPWTVVADDNGGFRTTWYVTFDELGATLQLTATGLASGLTAQETFTDNKNVNLTFAGTGSGSVVSSPGSINATYTGSGSGTGTKSTAVGNTVSVTLTATPAAGSAVGGWSVQHATVTAGGNPGDTTCTFTMLNTDASVTLTFNPAAKLAITTAPFTGGTALTAGVTSGTITVQLQDANGTPVVAGAGGVTVNLSSDSTGPKSFRDNATGNTTITIVSIASGSSSASFKYNDSKAGSPTITAAGASLTSATQQETVNKATPSISGVTSSQSITYGTATVALSGTVSASGPVYPANGETVSVTINGSSQNATISGGTGGFSISFPTATLPHSASSYTITYAYAGDANLNAAANNTATALTVNKANPNVTAWPTASAIAYGQTLASSTLSGGAATPSGSFAFTTPSTAPDVGTASQSVTYTPDDTANYNTAGSSVSVTVNKANPNVTAWPTASTITYGQTLASSTLSGGSATPAGSFAFTTPSTAPNAGTASQGVTYTPSDTTRYNTASGSVSVTVAAGAITVTAAAKSKTYGDADPALTYQITSGALVGSDSLSGSLTRAIGENVGSYAIQQGTLAVGGNYALTYAGASLSITARPITVTAASDNKVYDGTASSTGVPTITSGNLVNGDTATWTQVFNTKDTTANALIPSGSVSDGNGGNNYNITFVTVATHSINPRGLTVAANDATRVYGAPNPAFSASYSGFVAGEDASVLSGSPSLSTAADINSSVNGGPYDINVGTNALSALNYYFSPAKGHLTITPASATVGVASDKWTVPPTNSVTFAVATLANSPSAVTPSGSVQFVANGTNNLGSPVALDSNGQATLTVLGSALAHGSNSITAVFTDPAGNFNGSSGSLNPQQVVNRSPLSGAHALQTKINVPVTFNATELSGLDRDPDSDSLSVIAVSAASSNGGTASLAGGMITYTPPTDYIGSDSVGYTIADPFGGTNNCTLNVSVSSSVTTSTITHIVPLPDGNRKLVAFGVPDTTYFVQASTDMRDWTTISTNVAPANSVIVVDDLMATNYPSRFYRLASQQ